MLTQVTSNIQSVILTLAALLVTGALVAYTVAIKFGGESKKKRQLIFRLIGAIFIVICVITAQVMLHNISASE
jgi:hypothetical protein